MKTLLGVFELLGFALMILSISWFYLAYVRMPKGERNAAVALEKQPTLVRYGGLILFGVGIVGRSIS